MKLENRITKFEHDETLELHWPLTWNSFTPTLFTLEQIRALITFTNSVRKFDIVFRTFSSYKFRRYRRHFLSPIMFKKFEKNSLAIYKRYGKIRYSSFIDFFQRYRVDVPKSFYGIRSLRRLNFEYPLLKFSNFLMQDGKREKIFNYILQTFHAVLCKNNESITEKNLEVTANWFHMYHFYNTIWAKPYKFSPVLYNQPFHSLFDSFFARKMKYCTTTHHLKSYLLKRMIVVHPLFHFFVYNVDKNIRKFSRKKGSKYVFIWKYVPFYKRNLLATKLVAKNLKFQPGRTFCDRFTSSLTLLATHPKQSYPYEINQFINNYVFKNLSKTLLTNLKTTS